jgi:hypothetical protein
MSGKARFILLFDHSANEVNRRPNLRGEYRLAGENTARHELSLWGGLGQNGRLYARGHAIHESTGEAIRGFASQDVVEAPPSIDLKIGEAVIFENLNATAKNRQPKYFGYAREPNQYVKLSGWERGHTIAGNAEPYRPGANAAPHPAGIAPAVKG